jgi:hypothetical protein
MGVRLVPALIIEPEIDHLVKAVGIVEADKIFDTEFFSIFLKFLILYFGRHIRKVLLTFHQLLLGSTKINQISTQV